MVHALRGGGMVVLATSSPGVVAWWGDGGFVAIVLV